ncbi:methyltransferase domain-containing protein [Candidatus Bathyarchaeota archaeon]|nr:methyltransferase domain-containing protein [Candidatus Bathyarchaeota archaeon]
MKRVSSKRSRVQKSCSRDLIVRRRDLEIVLQKVAAHPKPKMWLEQYTIPPDMAAEILLIASIRREIAGRSVVDLGCGTGRLAIGARILGAAEVVGVDIDPAAVLRAVENAGRLGVKNIEWVVSDIEAVRGPFDIALMNPPFGTRTRHADRRFLLKALSIAETIYSIHKRSTRGYLLKFIEDGYGRVEALYEMQLEIPRTYIFHEKKTYSVEVDLYIVRSRRWRIDIT